MNQVPHAKTLLPGGTVTLTVSKGPQLFEVPGVRGKTFGEAKQILEAAGFKVERNDLIGSFLNRSSVPEPGRRQHAAARAPSSPSPSSDLGRIRWSGTGSGA